LELTLGRILSSCKMANWGTLGGKPSFTS